MPEKTSSKGVLIVILIIAVSAISLYGLGIYMSEKCLDAYDCKQCWNELNVTEKTNAYVELVTCSCGKARYNSYNDPLQNEDIVRMYRILTGSIGSVQDICEGRVPMTKMED